MSTADVPLQASVPLVSLEVPAPDRRDRSAFADGEMQTLGGILVRGFALTLVTLGIYRFWMKTNIRRWYWSNTVIGGDALEYRGTGRELFIGFLFAIGILLPFYAVIVGGTYFSGLLSWEVGSNLFLVVMAAFAQFASYRARRYRLTRTVWRGLTFAQDGSGWVYAGRWFLAVAISLLTLGLAVPWARAFLEGYRVRHTRFGSAEGAFAPQLGRPVVTWCILLIPALLSTAAALVYVYRQGGLAFIGQVLAILFGISDTQPDAIPTELLPSFGVLSGGLGLTMLWALLVWPAYKTEEFRAFTSGTRIGPVAFQSAVRKRWYYFAVLRFVLVLAFVLVLIGAVVALIVVLGGSAARSGLEAMGETPLMVLILLIYLAMAIGFVILRELVLVQGFWRHALSTLTVTGLDETDDIVARGQEDRAVGEGLADAFELGGF